MIGKRFRSLPFISANDNYTLSANRNGSYIDCTLDSMPENDTTYSKDIVSSPAPTVKGMMYFLYPKRVFDTSVIENVPLSLVIGLFFCQLFCFII